MFLYSNISVLKHIFTHMYFIYNFILYSILKTFFFLYYINIVK